jgi:hypothetical protein
MQSTLDRKVIALMLRAARRQEAKRRREAERRRKPEPDVLPTRLTGDAWWLNAPPAAQATRAIASPRLVAANDSGSFSERLTTDE